MKTINLLQGDSYELLKTLSDNSVDSVVTDPPYGLSFMGKDWDSMDKNPAFQKEFWIEVFRVLKYGGHLIAFSGSRTYHHMAIAVELAGFEIRDQIIWLRGKGFPKTKNHLKPLHEPMVLARKPLSESTVIKNIEKWGTGGINIEDNRIPYTETNRPIPQIANNKREVNSKKTMFDGNSLLKSKTKAVVGGSIKGRVPANVITDQSEEILPIFPNDKKGVSAIRFYFYCNSVETKEREYGLESFPEQASQLNSGGIGRKTSVEKRIKKHGINTATRKNIHPTVKPIKLMEHLINLITPKGGTCLDPFMGSGSTGIASMFKEFDFIGMELDEGYFKIAKERIEYAQKDIKEKQKTIFNF